MNRQASTKCPKCGGASFEAVGERVHNSNVAITFVRCLSCKTAVGVLPEQDPSFLIKVLAEKLNIAL